VRSYIRKIAKPGIPLTQLCETLEDSVRNLIEARGLDAGGWGFGEVQEWARVLGGLGGGSWFWIPA
jgi:hypothetical protein